MITRAWSGKCNRLVKSLWSVRYMTDLRKVADARLEGAFDSALGRREGICHAIPAPVPEPKRASRAVRDHAAGFGPEGVEDPVRPRLVLEERPSI